MSEQTPSPNTAGLPPINLGRLKNRLVSLSHFGASESGGVNRLSFSEADMAARSWLIERLEGIGLAAHLDAVGNVIGRWNVGSGPAVMLGSHLDSVPEGGRFDGALGVVSALECVETLIENGIEPAAPVEIVGTSEEEGRFGGMLGAQAIARQVDPEWFRRATDEAGQSLHDAMRRAGLVPEDYGKAARRPEELKAFLELHIEQGPVLERLGLPIGIVEGISGVFNWSITLSGAANHAGTTPMELRRDAFRGLADFGHALETILADQGTAQSRLTVGQVELSPNFPHSVAGEARFSLVGRDLDEGVMQRLAKACRQALEAAAERHGLGLDIRQTSWLKPTPCDGGIVEILQREADALGFQAHLMPSGAGHDAQVMAALVPAGLIFVPSHGGVSHAAAENSDWEDIEKGVTLLLHALLALAAAHPHS